MSKYTTEVRYLCETAAGLDESKGFNNIDSILTQAAPQIFNFTFPIFDENYRLPLEKTILRHYYTREISEETVGLWKLRLWDRLSLIMPYYNKLYLSETLEFNPLYDVDYTRTSTTELGGSNTQNDTESSTRQVTAESERSETSANTETRNLSDQHTGTDKTENDTTVTDTKNLTDRKTGTQTEERDLEDTHTGQNSSTGSNTQRNLFSDTPQGALTGVENETYLTDARKITDSSSSSGSDSYTDGHTGTDETTFNTTDTHTGTDTAVTDGEQLRTVNLTDTQTGTVGNSGTTSGSDSSEQNETGSRTIQGRGTVNNTTEFVEHVIGKQGSLSYVQMIKEYRDALINIDQMILDELSDLFIALW